MAVVCDDGFLLQMQTLFQFAPGWIRGFVPAGLATAETRRKPPKRLASLFV